MAVPLHFTIEFLGFLVTAGGAFLVLSRPTLVPGPAFNRVVASLGFAVLAAAQVMHGGSFLEADGADLLIAMRALGLVLLLVGVVGTLGSSASTEGGSARTAAVGFALRKPLLLAPAGAALLLAVTSFAASTRQKGRALARLGLAALFLGASEILTAAVPNARFSAGIEEPLAYAAHGTKALGFILLGAWLWAGVRTSIRTRFVASFVTLLVVVVLVLSSALTGVISNNVQDDELNRVSAQLDNAVKNLEGATLQDVLSNARASVSSFRSTSSRIDSKPEATTLRHDFDFDFLVLIRPNGQLGAAAGAGPWVSSKGRDPVSTDLNTGDIYKLLGSKTLDAVLSGAPEAASAEGVLGDAVALIAAVEIRGGAAGEPAGVLMGGRYVDALEMEEISKTAASAFATIMVDGKVLGSSLPCKDVARRTIVPRPAARSLETEGSLTLQREICNRPYFSAVGQLSSASNVPVATLVLSSPASIVAKTREGVTRILFIVAIGIGAVALLLAWLSGRRITRPIQALTATAREVREGDLTAKARVVGDDEVGQLGETFNEMTSSLLRMTDDLREAAREEHRLRDRIETIIQSMADGLVAVDADRKVLAFNREAEQLTGLKSSKAIGKPIEDVVHARDAQGQDVRLPIYDLLDGSVGGAFLEANGSTVPVAVTCAVLRGDDGELAGGVAVLRNMTREREIERMKSEFLSNISHELRTPLTPIKGYAEILGRKDVPPEKSQQFARGILESTERLERIVQLLVDFSAMEAGRLSPRTTPVDVGALVSDVAGHWKGKAPRHELVVDVKARLPKVLGDERLLRRSLEEILDNAVKFSPAGGTIRLEAKGAPSRNGSPRRRAVEVSVTDEGIGISAEDLTKIFSDFHQLDGSETRTYGGLGLGLAFVQRIVEAHAGTVDVVSEPDEGTKFTMTIPAATRGKTAPAGSDAGE